MENERLEVETTSPHTQGIRITKKQSKTLTLIGLIFSAVVIATALFMSASSAGDESGIRTSSTIIAPAAAGGGWDTVAREMQQAQRANGIVNNAQVLNIPGAGGTIALGQLGVLSGKPNNMMVGGTGQLAATIQYDSETTYENVTPLAVTVEEYDVIVVPQNSPYQSLEELITAWKVDPKKIAWTGGGSFDRLVSAELAMEAGISPADMIYVNSDGGGEAMQSLLNGTTQAAASGYADTIDQIESGNVRALAIVAQEPLDGVDIPTTVEQGYDVTLANWRLLVAPGGISEEDRQELMKVIDEALATSEWKKAVKNYHWKENYIAGEELKRFLADQKETISKIYEELGL